MTEISTLLKPKDVARMLACSPALIYKLADRGQIPCVRWECPGNGAKEKRMLRFELAAIHEFITKHRQKKN